MRAVPRRAAPPDPAPYAPADADFAEAKAYLSSREALQMSESDLERELHRRRQGVGAQAPAGGPRPTRSGEAAGPVARDARKPIFSLAGGDGALGSHAAAAPSAFHDFKRLLESLLQRTNVRSTETVLAV